MLKSHYVEGVVVDGFRTWPSYQNLADDHNVSAEWLRKKAAAEGWAEHRREFIAKTEQLTRSKKTEVLAEVGARFDTEILRLAEQGISLIARGLDAAQSRVEANGELAPADPRMLSQLGLALRQFQAAGRVAMGQPADNPAPNPFLPTTTGGASPFGELVVRVVYEHAAPIENRVGNTFENGS